MSTEPWEAAWKGARGPLSHKAAAIVNASVKDGKVRPTLPEGGREEVVFDLLLMTSVMFLLYPYIFALQVAQVERGIRYEQRPSRRLKKKIAAAGFGRLSDDELASLALSPEGLLELFEYLADPERKVGDELIAERLECHRRTKEITTYLADPSRGASWLITKSDQRRALRIHGFLVGSGLFDGVLSD